MPTIAENIGQLNGIRETYEAVNESWTDAYPVCTQTGVGFATNQQYRKNGSARPQEVHSFEDKSFHLKMPDADTYFYGLFDGHDSGKASAFAATHLPAEVLFGQMSDQKTDDDIRDMLRQSFIAVEKEYFQLISDTLAEKASVEERLQGMRMTRYEAYMNFPSDAQRLERLTAEVCAGTTAVVALMHRNRLHIANVGDSRAILCKKDSNDNKYIVRQLSTDHNLLNDQELQRLSRLGLNVDMLRRQKTIGNQTNTRCIGNYTIKGGYKDFEYLMNAIAEPVIAEPFIKCGIAIDESCQFLILCSAGLYRALEEATGTQQVNNDIVRMITEEFRVANTLTGVAQAVVNKVCRIHQDKYFANTNECQSIEDITLMVRNFNHNLQHDISSPSARMPQRFEQQLRISVTEEEVTEDGIHNYTNNTLQTVNSVMFTVTEGSNESNNYRDTTTTTTTTESFEDQRYFDSRRVDKLELDSEGKIAAFVAFDEFNKAIENAKLNGEFDDFDDDEIVGTNL